MLARFPLNYEEHRFEMQSGQISPEFQTFSTPRKYSITPATSQFGNLQLEIQSPNQQQHYSAIQTPNFYHSTVSTPNQSPVKILSPNQQQQLHPIRIQTPIHQNQLVFKNPSPTKNLPFYYHQPAVSTQISPHHSSHQQKLQRYNSLPITTTQQQQQQQHFGQPQIQNWTANQSWPSTPQTSAEHRHYPQLLYSPVECPKASISTGTVQNFAQSPSGVYGQCVVSSADRLSNFGQIFCQDNAAQNYSTRTNSPIEEKPCSSNFYQNQHFDDSSVRKFSTSSYGQCSIGALETQSDFDGYFSGCGSSFQSTPSLNNNLLLFAEQSSLSYEKQKNTIPGKVPRGRPKGSKKSKSSLELDPRFKNLPASERKRLKQNKASADCRQRKIDIINAQQKELEEEKQRAIALNRDIERAKQHLNELRARLNENMALNRYSL